MYVIITYDVSEKRVNKVCKKLKKYFYWSQNSVFEGEITEGKLLKCIEELKRIIDQKSDSIYVYKIKITSMLEKQTVGVEKIMEDKFI
ncbi:MAG: CRISPR-associated endonuclease Cas2 [Fervidobacterium sp.]